MEICNYKPQKPHSRAQHIIQKLFLTQRIRQFKIVKPQLSMKKYNEQKIQKNATLRKLNVSDYPKKQKIISKLKQKSINRHKEIILQKMNNFYLLNYLHQSNKLNIHRKKPANLSILQTYDQGCYLEQGKKDYPHFSNTIQLSELPQISKSIFVKRFQKQNIQERVFSSEQNIILKIKILNKFLFTLFKLGNQDFEPIAEKVQYNIKTIKLIYDMFTDIYRIDKQFRSSKGQLAKSNVLKFIRKDLNSSLELYKKQCSYFIPKQEMYISLANLKKCIVQELAQE